MERRELNAAERSEIEREGGTVLLVLMLDGREGVVVVEVVEGGLMVVDGRGRMVVRGGSRTRLLVGRVGLVLSSGRRRRAPIRGN